MDKGDTDSTESAVSKDSASGGLLNRLSVGNKVGLFLLLLVIVAAVNVALVYQATQANEKAAEAVDVAGSNRMWSQRAAFITFMIKDGHPDQQMLQNSVSQIDANLQALDRGGTVGERTVNPVPTEARDELQMVQEDWAKYRAAAEVVIKEDPYSPEFQEALTYLNDHNNDLLKESNDIVVAYTQLSNSGDYADEINVAGRQRMLSQRITKHAMAISALSLQEGTEARAMLEQQDREAIQVHRDSLTSDLNEYDSALNALENGGTHKGTFLQPAPASVKTEIDDVTAMWPMFKQNAQVVQSTHRLDTEFWTSLAYIEENVDRFVDENRRLTSVLATISTERSQNLRTLLIGLLGVDIVVFLIGIFMVRRTVSSPLQYIAREAERIADRDLTDREIAGTGRGDEIGDLSNSFDDMLNNLRTMMGSLKRNSATVASSAEELAAANEETNAASEEIASMIQSINDAAQDQAEQANRASVQLQKLSERSDAIADKAETAEDISTRAREKAESGGQAAAEAMQTMEEIRASTNQSAQDVQELGQKSEEIGKIVDMITEMAEQTNLLALNAAIEAARAGEQGKGFAVVAEEIRKLAEESTQAAGQISDIVTDIQSQTGNAVDSMDEGTTKVARGAEVVNQALAALEEITDAVADTSNKVQEISGAAQEQTDMVRDTVGSIDQISTMAESTAANTEDVSAASEEQTASMQQVSSSAEELSHIAEDLQALVEKFRLEED